MCHCAKTFRAKQSHVDHRHSPLYLVCPTEADDHTLWLALRAKRIGALVLCSHTHDDSPPNPVTKTATQRALARQVLMSVGQGNDVIATCTAHDAKQLMSSHWPDAA